MITNVTVPQLFKKIEFKTAYTGSFPKVFREWVPVTCTSKLKVFLPEEVESALVPQISVFELSPTG